MKTLVHFNLLEDIYASTINCRLNYVHYDVIVKYILLDYNILKLGDLCITSLLSIKLEF